MALTERVVKRALSAEVGEEEPKRLREGSYLAMELSTRAPVPEWDGQEVFAMAEDPAYLTPAGWRFFVPRQEAYYVIQGDEGRTVSTAERADKKDGRRVEGVGAGPGLVPR